MTSAEKGSGHFRDLFVSRDRLRYLAWVLVGKPGVFRGKLKDGTIIRIRPSDWEAAYEVFFVQAYRTPVESSLVKRIVDVGGHVGYSCLYWAKHFPAAYIETFEPHPEHCRILSEQLKDNHLLARVRVYPAAAACRNADGLLSDKGISSAMLSTSQPGAIQIRMVDLFAAVGTGPIDIIKIDIEGGEYELFADPRFELLAQRIGYLTMEYHERGPGHLGGGWCEKRLRDLGFQTEKQQTESDLGMIRAQRG